MKLLLCLGVLLFARASFAQSALPTPLSPVEATAPTAATSALPVASPVESLPEADATASVVPAPKLAKFEPQVGCYIGAFIDRDFNVRGDIAVWEKFTKKKHASFITYVGWGHAFPQAWVEKVKKAGAVPHFGMEPNKGLDEVVDGPYLRAFARDAARAKVPIFLRWASEMNGPWTNYGKNPKQYVEKFRLISRVMKEEAPNVAMVWTPFAEKFHLIPSYYPGDEWVDWVGINIYAVYVNNGDPFQPAAHKDVVAWLRWMHDRYGARKPIHVSEFAATIYCKGTSKDTVDFAIDRMTKFYTAIRDEFPRVKAVNWFCWDTIRAKLRNNNYSFIDDGRTLATYRRLVADPHFLSDVEFDASKWPAPNPTGTTLGPNGTVMYTGSGADESLNNSGALNAQGGTLGENAAQRRPPASTWAPPIAVSSLEAPVLQGIAANQTVTGMLELKVVLPRNLEAERISSVSWLIDGRTVWMTNTAPWNWTLRSRRLTPGTHTAQVQIRIKDSNSPLSSPEVSFEVAD